MSQRLPVPGGDNGTWGDILNAYLSVSLAADGTLNPSVVGTSQIQSGAVTNAQLDSPTQTTLSTVASKYVKPSGGIPLSDLSASGTASSTTFLRGDNTWSTPAAGVTLDSTASDIAPLGTQSAGNTGKAADAGHIHPTTGLVLSSALGAASGVATLNSSSQLTNSQLPSSVVSVSQLAEQGSVLDVQTIYPEQVNPSHTFGSGDDTAAMQAVIDYCTTNNVGRVKIRLPYVINLSAAPRTDRDGNAILALPSYGGGMTPAVDMTFECHPDGTSVNCGNSTAQSYSATYGTPSVIGGPTPEQLGTTNGNFSKSTFRIKGRMNMYLQNNSTFAGVDLGLMNTADIDSIQVSSGGYKTTAPTSTWAFGVRLPEGDNAGVVEVRSIEAEGMYAGVVGNSAHINAVQINAHYCVTGLGITGNEQYHGNDGHSSIIHYLLTQECNYHIASWSPSGGAISLPSSNPAQVVISLWDIEDWVNGTGAGQSGGTEWYATTDQLLDANNELSGKANYARVVANVGPVTGVLTISGGANFGLTDITAPPINGAPVVRVTTGSLGVNERTIFSGSTGGQTLTLPTAPPNGTVASIANYSSNRVAIQRGGSSDTINHYAVALLTSLTLFNPMSAELIYLSGVWYVMKGGWFAGLELGTLVYGPGTLATYSVTGTLATIDTTNLAVTFPVPPNGIMDIEFSIDYQVTETTNPTALFLGLWDATNSVQRGDVIQIAYIGEAGTNGGRAVARWHLSGLAGSTAIKFEPMTAYSGSTGSAANLYAQAATAGVSTSTHSQATIKAIAGY